MSLVAINWKPNARELRLFGVTMLIGCGLIGVVFQFVFKVQNVALFWYIFGGVVGLLGLTGTKVAMPGYWAWMGVAFVMGNIMSRVIIALVFYLVVTPMGLVRRLFGHDDLHLRKTKSDSYWSDVQHVADRSRYERQF